MIKLKKNKTKIVVKEHGMIHYTRIQMAKIDSCDGVDTGVRACCHHHNHHNNNNEKNWYTDLSNVHIALHWSRWLLVNL